MIITDPPRTLDELYPVRELPTLNTNYDPPQPWRCATRAAHDCDDDVVGAVGAYPVCCRGAEAEQLARAEQAERMRRLLADPEFQATLAREAEVEMRIETGWFDGHPRTRPAGADQAAFPHGSR